MASNFIPVVYESTTKGQNLIIDVYSKDLEHSNSSQREHLDDDYKPSCRTFLENSSNNSTPVLDININDPVKHTQDDRVSKSEEHPYTEANFSEETSEEYGSISKENQTISSIRNSNKPFSNEANIIQPILSVETKSHEVIHCSASKENAATEKLQPALPEEIELTREIQPALPEEIELNQEIQPALPEEIELNQEIQPALAEETELIQEILQTLPEETKSSKGIWAVLSEETESVQAISSALSEETESTRINRPLFQENEIFPTPDSDNTASIMAIQPAQSEETELSKAKKLFVSEEFNLNNPVPFKSLESSYNKKAPISASDSKIVQIPSNDVLNPSAAADTVSKGLSKNDIDISNPDENPDSSFPLALDMEGFCSKINTGEYKNGLHYVIPGKGRVIVTPTTPCEPIFKDFEMPPLSIEENYPMMTIKPSSPTKDIVTKDVCAKRSLSTMLAMLADWLQRGMDKKFHFCEQPIDDDFVNYSKMELKYGQNLLKQMNTRIETLVKASGYLPDPSTIIAHELGGEKTSIHDTIKYTGVEAQNRLEALKAKVTLGYNRIVSFCPNDAKLNNHGFSSKKLAIKAQDIFLDLFVKIYDDFVKLGMDIERFRGKIRYFCLKIDTLL